MKPLMKKVKGSGVTLNVAVWEGSEMPILCVHGITANCRCWDGLAKVLSPQHTLIALDLRGRGQSDKPPSGYSVKRHIQDIACLMTDLGIEKAVYMGHSLGAFIGLAFAAEYPQRIDRLILVDGGGDLPEEHMDVVLSAIKPAFDRLGLCFNSENEYVQAMRAGPYIHPWNDVIENYYRYEITETEGGYRTNINIAHIQEEALNVRKLACRQYYQHLQCPVLVLRAPSGFEGQNDVLLPEPVIQQMITEIPKASRYDVTGVNHYGIVFQPHAERDAVIKKFLE